MLDTIEMPDGICDRRERAFVIGMDLAVRCVNGDRARGMQSGDWG